VGIHFGQVVNTAAFSAIASFRGRLSQPVDGDPALRWTGPASETTMTTGNPISPCRRAPWNKGRLIGQQHPLKPKEVWTIRVRLPLEGHRRDFAMFNLAIDSELRGCDLVRLTIDDVVGGGRVRDRAIVIQKKTGRPVQFEVTEQTRSGIGEWLAEFEAGRADICSPAVSGGNGTFRRASTRASSIDGLSAPVSIVRFTAHIQCAEQSRLKFTGRRAT